MRILPRSAKGTWLLAAVAWVGLCAVVWWLLPTVPRVSWTLPEPSGLRFLSGADELVTRTLRFYPIAEYVGMPPAREPDGPVRVWEAKTGRLLRSYAPDDENAPRLDAPLPDNPQGTDFRAASGDRRVVATSLHVSDTVREIAVWEVGSLRKMSAISVRPGIQYVTCRLNQTGAILAAALTDTNGKDAGAYCWESATGRELLNLRDASQVAISGDGNTLLDISDPVPPISLDDVPYRLSAWDVGTRRKRFTLDLVCGGFMLDRDSPFFSPNCRVLAAPTGRGPVGPLGNLARRRGIHWPFGKLSTGETITLFDAANGREIGCVAGEFRWARWSPESRLLATLDDDRHVVRIWDIPPRKPLGWFAIAAGIVALPIAWIARRRVRRLRSACAS
jgi:WD40 repeat protein